ncbi:MAG: isoprenyl transferase [Saprospiraceae bacterium]|nr:isoprenyl transferase [Saprospiraceae bacterium]
MESLKDKVDLSRLPQHVAVIMDGNGRWARRHGKPRVFGHRNGVKAVREVTEAAAELGVNWLTLYAFSTENWNRPRLEINALMSLLVDTLRKEIETLNKNNIRLAAIGDLSKLPDSTHSALIEGINSTASNDRMTLTLALNYSARWEIAEAARGIATDLRRGALTEQEIDEDLFGRYLATAGMPDPELMIRTSGELRISNYLLWQLAYSELYFTEVFWPDFNREHFYEALIAFQHRERRFGLTGDQVVK